MSVYPSSQLQNQKSEFMQCEFSHLCALVSLVVLVMAFSKPLNLCTKLCLVTYNKIIVPWTCPSCGLFRGGVQLLFIVIRL